MTDTRPLDPDDDAELARLKRAWTEAEEAGDEDAADRAASAYWERRRSIR